jgi:hypothetical protein
MHVNIHGLTDNAKCYPMVRQLRWPEGVEYPHCHATQVVKNRQKNDSSLDKCYQKMFRWGVTYEWGEADV